MTEQEALRIFKVWIDRDEKIAKKCLMDLSENIEVYKVAIQALETVESLRSYFKAHPYDLHWHGFKGEEAFDKIMEQEIGK